MDLSLWYSIPICVLTALIIKAHYRYKNAFRFWKDRGLSGPKASPVIGNMFRLATDSKAASVWLREFGKVYGIYEGSTPVLVVSDPKVMHQICVKDFDKFPNHMDSEFNTDLTKAFILNLKDDHWRRVRSILSPTFTSGKMRRMFKLIDVCADDMMEAMQERLKRGPIVNLRDLFGLYTMDAIASCCYGIRLLGYKKEASLTTASNRDEFVRLALKLFDLKLWRLLVIMIFPEWILVRLGVKFVPKSVEYAFANRIEQIIAKRQKSGKHFDDYLQTLIDSKLPTNNSQVDNGDNIDNDTEKHHIGAKQEESGSSAQTTNYGDDKKILSDIEVLASATFLLVVGLDTTSTLLADCVYALSFHQTIQEKLYQTIKSLARIDEQNKVSFDYDSLTSCQYLDAVVSETLRALSPLFLNDRVASDNYYLESHSLSLQKGTKIILPLYAMMNDPDYWPEPEVFDPERFMPEQQHKIVPNSYCPFGIGPRICLGMRFSLTESKIALAKLLMEFKFEPAPGTSYPPEMRLNFAFGSIKRPEVIVVQRQINNTS